MKKLAFLLIIFFLCHFTNAQIQGKIIYDETIKIEFKSEGLDENIKSMIPNSRTTKKELFFNDKISSYQKVKGDDPGDFGMESDDGSFKIVIAQDDTEDILYKNLKTDEKIHQKGLMGKSFVVTDKIAKHKWKITNEKIKYLDYECQKAIIEDEENFVVAWFTSQLPTQAGPGIYHGLPGAILMISVNDGKTEIKALAIDLSPPESTVFNIPNKGKKVTSEAYDKIQEEKIKEIKEMHGHGTIKIRN